jgi:hypothetical protein
LSRGAREPGPVPPDELTQSPLAADSARAWVFDHDCPWPDRLECPGIAHFKRMEVLRHRISPTRNLGLSPCEFGGGYEVREPGHRRLQARDELGHDLRGWLWLADERNALSSPQ